jgi:hypothetical protein
MSTSNLLGYNPNPYRAQGSTGYPGLSLPHKFTTNPHTEYELNTMMQKVKIMVNDLLSDITLLYKSMKVRFPVLQYESVLVRMLIPVELNAAINNN